jgi:hypothetical protein
MGRLERLGRPSGHRIFTRSPSDFDGIILHSQNFARLAKKNFVVPNEASYRSKHLRHRAPSRVHHTEATASFRPNNVDKLNQKLAQRLSRRARPSGNARQEGKRVIRGKWALRDRAD